MRPWLIGAAVYLLSLLPTFFFADDLAHLMVGDGSTFWNKFVYACALVVSFLLLFALSMILAMTLTLVLSAFFQEDIARAVLRKRSELVPQLSVSRSLTQEAYAISAELFRLLWLLPIFGLLVLIGFIPLLTPLALIAACWLLAFQFVDLALSVLGLGAFRRWGMLSRRPLLMLTFGALLTILWAIPLFGIFLAPIAVAAAASLVLNSSLVNEVIKNDQV